MTAHPDPLPETERAAMPDISEAHARRILARPPPSPLRMPDEPADLRTVAALPGHPDPADLIAWHVERAEEARARVGGE